MAKSVKILGIASDVYNSSAVLIINGKVAFGVQEERLVREKRTRLFPVNAIKKCFEHTRQKLENMDAIAIAVNPAIYLEKFDYVHSTMSRFKAEQLYSNINYLMNLKEDNLIKQGSTTNLELFFSDDTKFSIFYVGHHFAHAATAFFLSPFKNSAILSMDAFGEKDCVLFAEGTNNSINFIRTQEFPHSPGSFYATMTEFLGFRPYEDEWKLMGVSAYGDSKVYLKKIRKLVKYTNKMGFELDLSYFNFYQFHRPNKFSSKMTDLLGSSRKPSEPLLKRHYDIAASVQRVMEEIIFHLARGIKEKTGQKNICLTGGVAMNSVCNGKIKEVLGFKEVFIPPMPDDSGNSIGAALYVYYYIMHNSRIPKPFYNYIGPYYSHEQIEEKLKKYQIKYRLVPHIEKAVARMLSTGKIVGWFQGGLEFGDRALGNRSILADPRIAKMKDKVNKTIKYREEFRPFAPSILDSFTNSYFEIDTSQSVPYMEKVFLVRKDKRKIIPAVVHIDGTGRLQTVTKEQNLKFWTLINEFYKITDVPVILNTSFNLKGEPIVCSPDDALKTFYTSGLDALVLDNFLIIK